MSREQCVKDVMELYTGRSTHASLPSVPAQPHSITAVGRFYRHRAHVAAIVHREPHGTAQPPVVGHHVCLPPPCFTSYHVSVERDRAVAIDAEPGHHLAAAIDLDIDLAQSQRTRVVIRRFSAAVAPEIQGVIPREPALPTARPVEIVGTSTAWTSRARPIIRAGHGPRQPEVVAAES